MTQPLITAADMSSLRLVAESLMTATITVRYKTGKSQQNESDGAELPIMAERFTSRAKFQSTGATVANNVEVGGRQVVIDQMQVHYPVSMPQVQQDDEITCDTNPLDPRLEGRVFIVGDPMNKTYATATRLNVKEKP